MDIERRSGYDRRQQTAIIFRLFKGEGNRKTIRRQEDRDRIFLADQYSPLLFATICTILFLCVIDALLTLFLINHGAYEIIPIMAFLMKIGPYTFFIFKYALTCIVMFGLFLFRKVVIIKLNVSAHSLLHLLAWIYVSVIVWELYLVYNVIDS